MAGSKITVVVPVWHDDEALQNLLALLGDWQLDVIVVDGASAQSTAMIAKCAASYTTAAPSRGAQIAQGVSQAKSDWIWVMHADCVPSTESYEYLCSLALCDSPCWGRFDVVLPGVSIVSKLMNWRSRWSKICTGDQAMFFHAQLLQSIDGYPAQPLMEDIEVSRRLKRRAPTAFHAANASVQSSSRRWLDEGIVKTIVSMWAFRIRYFFGAPAELLFKQYYRQQ